METCVVNKRSLNSSNRKVQSLLESSYSKERFHLTLCKSFTFLSSQTPNSQKQSKAKHNKTKNKERGREIINMIHILYYFSLWKQ